jgi:hypothetical protein
MLPYSEPETTTSHAVTELELSMDISTFATKSAADLVKETDLLYRPADDLEPLVTLSAFTEVEHIISSVKVLDLLALTKREGRKALYLGVTSSLTLYRDRL